ncbi:MAG TPA: SAF domain-containing protein [Pseudonocardiaceae bacterium]|jgi:Flp pilus assembly protein CpaB|nr:SAF domain-containing protein [Pseudonocardiaceae bacterium]
MGRGGNRTGPRTLAPLLRDRLGTAWQGGWSRTVLLRRVAAGLLVLLAAALALTPRVGSTAEVLVVVAAHDLAPGAALDPSAVQLQTLPDGVVPDGSAHSVDDVVGRLLAAPLRRGEPITDVRLTGAALTRSIAADPGAVSVPVRLSDPDVATLLHPGATVDVVSLSERQDQAVVLARGARVLTVLAPGKGSAASAGRLVLVALNPDAATRVAGASLSQAVTVTLR